MLEQFRKDPAAKSLSYFAAAENVAIDERTIDQLMGAAMEANGNARICLHQSAEDGFHQMLIIEWRGRSFPAHRHPAKSEGYHLIRGRMDLILYAEDGTERRRYGLGPEFPIARVGPGTFHALEVISPYAVYLESKPGPFVRDTDKVMAPWLDRT